MTEQSIISLLKNALKKGAPLYNNGDIQGCYEVYSAAAKEAQKLGDSSPEFQTALDDATKAKDAKESAWILRRCFDSILDDEKKSKGDVESLSDLLTRTINEGAPLYNEGDKKACYELYLESAKHACEQEQLAESAVGQLLGQACDEAMALGETGDYDEAAWVLRRSFDDILEPSKKKSTSAAPMPSLSSIRGVVLRGEDFSDGSSVGYWQDEKTQNTSDFEIGTCLSDFAYILRASIQPTTHKRYTGKSYDNSFPGSEAVEVLTGLGLAKDRKMAVMKCSMLLAGSFLIPVSHENETSFRDGTHLYRFSEREELQTAFDKLQKEAPKSGEHPERSLKAQLVIALQNTLDLPSVGQKGDASHFSGVSAKHLEPFRGSTLSPEQQKGHRLAQSAIHVEKVVDVKARKHLLKTYERCFVGKDAVTTLVTERICSSKEHAVELMKELTDVGLVHHVVREHGFEDKALFYRFTSSSDIRKALDAIAILPNDPTGTELTRQAALMTRYQQFADLDVAGILNSFFGTDSKEGWDLVDLQNWRDNMKRWGFGRREDQDDVMVDKLSPLALHVDPETWYESLTTEEREKWESPWGILAQVAIFDQVPRSAFRGTPEAFKWDPLAIKASKIAIERGYFETAYKSTLNQFLVLLPLEHSESWEDQKLGVTLLLRLLSTVAVQDEGLSDYEIVKRLEFSKRLSTAFLEHAQIIAKFKRYPHRNKPLSRNATLEERVWLASDLVPRWAKSQNPEDARKNVIQLPVIPLKKLTRR